MPFHTYANLTYESLYEIKFAVIRIRMADKNKFSIKIGTKRLREIKTFMT